MKNKIWCEGKYLDLWSIIHFLSGAIIAGLCVFIGLSFITGLVITLGLVVIWEIFELIKSIKEALVNRFIDIIIGVASFIIAYCLFNKLELTICVIFFAIIFIVWIILGLRAYGFYPKNNARRITKMK